ncbi:apolipoprotein N-acyltransferase [Murinocardiopsis flavida]|uniref:Apolipoprotein N-acyltransferase n=1 Tax=Murinocardiopsis flavida TaxID=645275 RepID=A0A2P8DLK5_9ACTN|nr:nitrilase-related carbon-nitrogen hydrolase [Murinocardiopsis flavida]PSK98100.1 apolipoprotein N-acyltransferase [Murinocardiopsis flavida]
MPAPSPSPSPAPAALAEAPARPVPPRRRFRWLFAGLLLTLFSWHADWDIAAAAWLAAVPLMRFTRLSGPVNGFAWVFGLGLVAAAAWMALSGLLVPGFWLPLGIVSLAAVTAVPLLADRLLAPRLGAVGTVLATLVFPTARVACEFLIGEFSGIGAFLGVLGTTQHANLPLIQLASVTGAYGVSFLVAWSAPVTVTAWERGFALRRVRGAVAAYTAVLGAVLAGGGLLLAFAAPASDTVRVVGVSPARAAKESLADVDRRAPGFAAFLADRDAQRAAFGPVQDDIVRRTEDAARSGADVVSWPETDVPTTDWGKDALVDRVGAVASEHGVHVLMGLLVYTEDPGLVRNQAVLVGPDGAPSAVYDKAHPTPMEAVAMEPGDGVLPARDTRHGRIGVAICYDADFPALMRQGGRAGVDLMLVPANDWSGIDRMHPERATLRAVENGYALVRQATNGIATAVDHQGRPLGRSDHDRTAQQTMTADVPSSGVPTLYSRIGDTFAWLCVAATTGAAAAVALRRRRDRGRAAGTGAPYTGGQGTAGQSGDG